MWELPFHGGASKMLLDARLDNSGQRIDLSDHGQSVAVVTVSRRHHPPTLGQLGGLPQRQATSFVGRA